jgi:hypothetical protein
MTYRASRNIKPALFIFCAVYTIRIIFLVGNIGSSKTCCNQRNIQKKVFIIEELGPNAVGGIL